MFSSSPDSFPSRFLNDARESSLLTSSARPKQEEFEQMDTSAQLLQDRRVVVPDSLRGTFGEAHLALGVYIDERGRIAAHELPWFEPRLLPEPVLHLALAGLPGWRFQPATRGGTPRAVWSNVELVITP
jgi:hypothetical protein